MNPPIPKLTLENVQGAIGDIVRASAAFGQADARGENIDAHVTLCLQTIAQLLTLIMQAEPSPEHIVACMGIG